MPGSARSLLARGLGWLDVAGRPGRAHLTAIAVSAETSRSLIERMRRQRLLRWSTWTAQWVLIGWTYLQLVRITSDDARLPPSVAIPPAVVFLLAQSALLIFPPLYRDYRIFRRLVRAAAALAAGEVSPAASARRRETASEVRAAVRIMRGYAPPPWSGWLRRPLRVATGRSTASLLGMIPIVLFGDRTAMIAVRDDLARAALRVAGGNWVQVAHLDYPVAPSERSVAAEDILKWVPLATIVVPVLLVVLGRLLAV